MSNDRLSILERIADRAAYVAEHRTGSETAQVANAFKELRQLFHRLELVESRIPIMPGERRCKVCGYVAGSLPHPKYCGPADPTTGQADSHHYEDSSP